MPARNYAQFLDATGAGQSADDDFRIPQAPPEILRGSFRIHYIPLEDSHYGSRRYLLSVQTSGGHLGFAIDPYGTDSQVLVLVNGAPFASTGLITFSALQELELIFCGPDSTITVSGATTGNGTTVGASPWNIPGSMLRLGGNVLGTSLARGYVSLPYAIPGAFLPGPITLDPSEFDFRDPTDTALISLL